MLNNLDKPSIAKSLIEKFVRAEADDAIVDVNENQTKQIKFANSKISITQSWNRINADIFVAVGKKLVSTSLKDFSENAVLDSVDRIMKFVKATKPTEEYEGIAEGPFDYPEIDETYDPKVESLDEKAVDLTMAGINASINNGVKRNAGVLESSTFSSYLLTTNNVEAEDKGTTLYFSLRALIDKYASGHSVSNSRILKKFNPEEDGIQASETAKLAQNPEPGKEGTYDVLFEPLPFSNILCQIGEASSVFNVESHLSCLAGKLGEQVAASRVTLKDQAGIPNGYNSTRFDAEGTPTQTTPIIQEGILKNYLHNTSTAKRHNTKTTGNAGIIAPTPFNIVLEKGDSSREEIISEMKKGLIITNVWYTRFQNYANGDFSTIPRDGMFTVENGKISGSVKELRVSENLLNILKNISIIGNQPKQVFGWEVELPVETPAVLVKDVNLTKSVA